MIRTKSFPPFVPRLRHSRPKVQLMEGRSLRLPADPVPIRTLALGLIAWCLGAVIFFRQPLVSGFQVILGNMGDGRLIAYLHEHLFQALIGKARLLSPSFYYPEPNVLGFSDAFLLDLVPYAPFRFLGFDPLLSFALMTVALSLLCFAACMVLCVRYCKIRPLIAVCAAALATFPSNLYYKVGAHPNFFCLYYIPVIVLSGLWACEDFPRVTRRSVVRIAIVSAAAGLLFATGYYSAWMFSFTALIAVVSLLVLTRRAFVAFVREHRKEATTLLAVASAAFALGLIPFVLIYVPVLRHYPRRHYYEYLATVQAPWDIINVGPENLVWGWLMTPLERQVPGQEIALAVTPGMAGMLVALVCRHWRQLAKPSRANWPVLLGACCLMTWLLASLLTFGSGRYSAFAVVRYVIPGATGIRNGGRIGLYQNLWVVLGLAVLTQYWIDTASAGLRIRRKLLAAGMLIFCLFEQFNVNGSASLERGQELLRLAAVPRPPPRCAAFLVRLEQQPADPHDQNDAMWIALATGVPTLNGSSGMMPKDWRLEDSTIDYYEAARQWIASSGLNVQVCLYDRSARQWSDFDPTGQMRSAGVQRLHDAAGLGGRAGGDPRGD